MPVNRDLLAVRITPSSCPPWQCGTCGLGTLVLDQKTFSSIETPLSKRLKHHDAWDVEWTTYRFFGFAVCSNDNCRDMAVISGSGSIDYDIETDAFTGHQRQVWTDHFVPQSIVPAPRLFPISEDIPSSVSTQLDRAFSLFWNDRGACVNALRAALEEAMTELKIKRFRLSAGRASKPKRRIRLSLHERIRILPSQFKGVVDTLVATKWIANAGAHGDDLETDDVYDALDLAEHSLNELFDTNTKRLRGVAKKINRRKGPRSS